MKGVIEVRRRFAAPPNPAHNLQSPLDTLVNILGTTTREYLLYTYGKLPEAEPVELDQEVESAPLLNDAIAAYPGRLDGPMKSELQVWTEAAPTSFAPERQAHNPAKGHFQTIPEGAVGKPTAGFYTSTLIAPPDQTMWRRHIERLEGALFPPPYLSYAVKPHRGARIAEVLSAEAWANLVIRYPTEKEGMLYPNWAQIAHDYDGVHLALPAVVAAQGIVLRTQSVRIASLFWDVETTLWLKWCFDSIELLLP